jgi:hypothetical protein
VGKDQVLLIVNQSPPLQAKFNFQSWLEAESQNIGRDTQPMSVVKLTVPHGM